VTLQPITRTLADCQQERHRLSEEVERLTAEAQRTWAIAMALTLPDDEAVRVEIGELRRQLQQAFLDGVSWRSVTGVCVGDQVRAEYERRYPAGPPRPTGGA
jgi:hypothetical protein